MTLGQKLRSLREGQVLTQGKLINLLGNIISQGRLSDIELDKPRKRDFIVICKMCDFFGISVSSLWNEIKDDPIYNNLILPPKKKIQSPKDRREGGGENVG